jgi:hypothetical protein
MDPVPHVPEDEEALASQFLVRVGFAEARLADFWLVCAALGLFTSAATPRACQALQSKLRSVHITERGTWFQQQLRGWHELAHTAVRLGGGRLPHCESAVQRIALRCLLPAAPMLDSLGYFNGNVQRLLDGYRDTGVPRDLVAKRLGWARRAEAVFWFARRSGILLAPDGTTPAVTERVLMLCRAVQETGVQIADEDLLAAPYQDGRREGVVVLVPRE